MKEPSHLLPFAVRTTMPSLRSRPTRDARRARLPAAVVAAALAACGDPAGPPRCTIALDPLPFDLVVAGTQVQAKARPSCDRGDPPALRWSVSDTAVATVDASGVVTGRAPGQAVLTAETVGGNAVRASTAVQVEPPYELFIMPRRYDLLPRFRQPLFLTVAPTELTPPGFPSTVRLRTSDSCVAIVDGQGFVVAGRAGTATISVWLTAAPGVRDSVPVTVGVPTQARTFVAGLTDAATGAVADPRALRGRVTVLVNLLYPQTGGRVEVRLGGRPAATLLLAPPPEASVTVARVAVTIDVDARDATGARRFPAGQQSLEAALVVPDLPGLPGCPVINLGDTDTQLVTLVGG